MDPEAALDEVTARVLAAVAPRADPPVLVAVDGRSGSGKSTFADAVVARLRSELGTAESVTLLRMDAVYPGWHGLDQAVRTLSEDVLPELAAGRDATYRSWLWTKSRPGPLRTVRPAPVVVVEGVGSGTSFHLLQLLVWVDAPDDVRHRRAMARDGDTYAPHWSTWAAQEERHLARHATHSHADVLVETVGPGA